MSTQPTAPRLHPMLWIAAISVTVVSMLGIASMTGLLPSGSAAMQKTNDLQEGTPPVVAEQPAPTPVPAATKAAAGPVATVEPAHTEAPTKKPVPEKHPTTIAKARPEPHQKPIARSEPEPAPVAYDEPVVPRAQPHLQCFDCGRIEAIRPIQARGEGSGIGAIAGGVLGGVLGHQMGKGTGKDLATIGGAVLGGIAGHQVEKTTRTVTRYEVSVRMDDGEHRVIALKEAPAWREGDRVAVRNGRLVSPEGAQPEPYSSNEQVGGPARF